MKTATKKRVTAILLVTTLLASLCGCAGKTEPSSEKPASEQPTVQTPQDSTTSAETIEMRLATSVNETNVMNTAAVHFSELVAERSDGRIKITVYPNKQLGDDAEVIEQMISGSLDMVEVSGIMFGNYSELPNAWQLPFLYDDWDHYAEVQKSDAAKDILDGMTDIGVQGLAVWTSFFRNVCSAKPVNSYEDCINLKIRTAESKMLLDAWAAMGFAPTPMAFGEVYTGLQNGVIDATETDPFGLVSDGFGEVCKYVFETNHYNWPALLAMNKEKFDALSAEDQAILLECAEETIDFNIQECKDVTDEYVQKSKDAGITYVTPTAEDIQYFRDNVEPVVVKYSELDPRIAAYVEFARSTSKY